MSEKQPTAFFVYGTLKRGYLRESVWPHVPDQIEEACIQAELFDLGPYPAIREGEGAVLGELWSFNPAHMQATIAALDEVEGFNQFGLPNYYLRKVVVATTSDHRQIPAFAYFMGDRNQLHCRRIEPSHSWNGITCASWPDHACKVPRNLEEEKRLEQSCNPV